MFGFVSRTEGEGDQQDDQKTLFLGKRFFNKSVAPTNLQIKINTA